MVGGAGVELEAAGVPGVEGAGFAIDATFSAVTAGVCSLAAVEGGATDGAREEWTESRTSFKDNDSPVPGG